MYVPSAADPHTQLRALYMVLLKNQDYFDEFKQMLALYRGVSPDDLEEETAEAATVRSKLNERIRMWTGLPLDELSAVQVLQWRAILVEERINIAISPWKESNAY